MRGRKTEKGDKKRKKYKQDRYNVNAEESNALEFSSVHLKMKICSIG